MINYIIIVLLAVILAASLITVITEYFIPKNTGAGRVLRAVRIRLRDKSRTSFCVTSIVILIFALVAGDDNMRMVWAAIIIMLITLIILHPEDLVSIFRHRKKKKKAVRLGLTPKLAGEVPLAKPAKELEPIEAEAVSEEGKE
jgi:predicted membrane protein